MKRLPMVFAVLACASMPCFAWEEPPTVRPFATLGLATLRSPLDFDRLVPGTGKGPAPSIGLGVEAFHDGVRVAVHGIRILDANSDGADIDFALGELRLPISGASGPWVAVGGGRIRGRRRKSSWVETLAIGKDLDARRYVEVRAVADEMDGRSISAALGWRF